MTDTLRQAVAQAEALPAPDQDALAAVILDGIASDARWDAPFAQQTAGTALVRPAAEAMDDLDAGRTRPLTDLLGER